MSYSAFLLATSQLASQGKARFFLEERLIWMEPSKKEHVWKVRTKVFQGEEGIPSEVRSCISQSGSLRFQNAGAYLQLDRESDSVFLIQEMQMEYGRYIPFRQHIAHFAQNAEEWSGFFGQLTSSKERV